MTVYKDECARLVTKQHVCMSRGTCICRASTSLFTGTLGAHCFVVQCCTSDQLGVLPHRNTFIVHNRTQQWVSQQVTAKKLGSNFVFDEYQSHMSLF